METAYIYTLSDPLTGFVRYVGKTFDLRQRLYDHTCNRFRDTHCGAWIRSLKKKNALPQMEVLESLTDCSQTEWQDAERFWISTLKFLGCDLTNLEFNCIGTGRLSNATKKKISNFRKTFRHTEETKRRIGLKSKARMTEEEKQRMRDKCLHFRHTEETKRRISELKRGLPKSPEFMERLRTAHRQWRIEMGHKLKTPKRT